MAIGSIVNALWDLWAIIEGKPLWKLLVDLAPEQIIASIDWRYLRDALTPDEALAILQRGQTGAAGREASFATCGPKAYSTAGWLGLTDEQITDTITAMRSKGFDCFKMKVGQDIRPHWIEEPTARDDVFGYRKIADALAPHGIGIAAGEQVPSPVIFKQLLQAGAIQFCQIDATRLAGVNDVLAVILLAAKHDIPVCPHGGGIGLCNMICHYALWDQIAVAAHSDTQVVEFINFLQDGVFLHPIEVTDGAYVAPTHPGWNLEMHSDFVDAHTYPTGAVWRDREASGGISFLA